MKKILINATNLHVGGGVQVAASLIQELASFEIDRNKYEVAVYCSHVVMQALPSDLKQESFSEFRVFDIFQAQPVRKSTKALFQRFDICFTVFGPMYFSLGKTRHLCGFAQPWIAYPDNLVYSQLNWFTQLKTRLKYFLQWHFFRRSDHLVVELDHVRQALIKKGYPKNRLHVVSNCVSSLYFDQSSWQDIGHANLPSAKRAFTLGFLGRAYAHKNLAILKEVDDILRSLHKIECNFLFSLDAQEMDQLGFTNRPNFYTTGSIQPRQCPYFYKHIDALIFPSLLECFSATPIEAMIMKKPVFASSMPFVRDVCGEYASYFQPLDATDIARCIAAGLSDLDRLAVQTDHAYAHALTLPTAANRAKGYLSIIGNILNE
jgi:glycosyltransferase involved in cell wall biosynthesis